MRSFMFMLVFLSSQVFAADFFWASGLVGQEKYVATIPLDSCKLWSKELKKPYYQANDTFTMTSQQANQGRCSFNWYNGSVPMQENLVISRRGEACPPGGVFNYSTGYCDLPAPGAGEDCEGPDFFGMPSIVNSQGQCVPWNEADKAASCKALAKTGTSFTDVMVVFDGDGNPEKPQVEKLGCAVQVVDVAQCKMPVPRCGSGICIEKYASKCKVGVTFTGEVAGDDNGSGYPVADGSEAEGVCPDDVDCTPPDEPVIEESKPCNYMYNGQVVGCESSEFKGDPGEMNCGSVNGGPYTCTKKVPTSNGVTIGTTITTEPQADGTSKQTKEDVHTKVTCTAPGSCTTQVTNNKTVTIKDGNGNTVSETGSCTGSNCSTGKGQTGNCPAGETCEGTEEDEFTGPLNESVPGFADSLTTFMSDVKGAPFLAAVSAIDIPQGGSCNFQSFNVVYLGTLSFAPMCAWAADWFGPLYYLMLAIWAIVAVRTFMEA